MNKVNLNEIVDRDGLAAGNAVHAEQKTGSPTYLVAVGTVSDPATFDTYAQQVPRTLMPFGGHFLAGRGQIEALEGVPPKFTVIIAFESLENANSWWNSPATRQLSRSVTPPPRPACSS